MEEREKSVIVCISTLKSIKKNYERHQITTRPVTSIIGDLSLSIEVLEKQLPKEPIQQATTEKTHYKCPCCSNIMQTIYSDGVGWGHIANYCEWCGQCIKSDV